MKTFLKALLEHKHLAKLKPREIAIFNVYGKFGSYQIKIWPMDELKKTRAVEINGHIHHLFMGKDGIKPIPTHNEINNNMKGTIILNNINVHLFDNKGDGRSIEISRPEIDGCHPTELINLAGEEGTKLLQQFENDIKTAELTYHIVQEDILKSI